MAALRGVLAECKALETGGRYREALEMASSVLAEAEGLGYAPVEVDALLRVAQLEGRVGRFAEMRQGLIAAAARGQECGYDLASGLAFALLTIAEIQSGDLAAARTWGRLAGAVAVRTGDRGELASVHRLFLGRLAEAEGNHEEAVEHHLAFLDLSAGIESTPRSVSEGYARLNLGRQYARLEQYDLAATELERAGELFTEALGGDHRAVAQTLVELAGLRRRQGDPEAAVAVFRRALATLQRSGQGEDWESAHALDGLAESLLDLGRGQQAVEALERSLAIRAELPEQQLALAHTRFLLARALWETGAPECSLRHATAARRELVGEAPAAVSQRAAVDRWLESHPRRR